MTLDSTAAAAASADRLLSGKDVQALGKSLHDSLAQMNRTLKSIESAGDNTSTTLKTFDTQLKKLAKQLDDTLYGLGPDSSMYWSLQETLKQVNSMAKSIDTLFKKLDHKPNALVFGE